MTKLSDWFISSLLNNNLFNLHPGKWFWGCHLRFFRTWIWLNIGLATNQMFFWTDTLFSDLCTLWNPAFLRLLPWKKSGWILPYFFRVAKFLIFSKLKIGLQIKELKNTELMSNPIFFKKNGQKFWFLTKIWRNNRHIF